ncbi:hypothetical protein EU528_10360 [Candidatus Thorarchaeota archaeon]|nr:MAG: hypothetical protein EU528_10360 [Candidatus Thorarchaeota archaeon]
MPISNTLPVRVWISTEECEEGNIEFHSDDVVIKLQSGVTLSSNISDSGILYEIQSNITLDEKGNTTHETLDSTYKIQLKPILRVKHPYTNQGIQFFEDIFPPSTKGFYGRLQAGELDALYTIHQIKDNPQLFLSISNPYTNQIYETLIIQPYEAEALSMIEDNQLRQTIFNEAASNRAKSREELLSILDSPSPSGQEFKKLIGDIYVPNLKIGDTMRETLIQIVPSSFPASVREELMVFLVYVLKGEIPDNDPLEYSFKFSSMTIAETLLNGHLMHLIDGTEWPSYAKLMTLAERDQLDFPKQAVSDSVKNTPWLLFNAKCAEHLPNWLDIAIKSAMNLNTSNKVVLTLPTSKSSARRSKKAWKQRFAEMSHRLRVYGHINHSSLGIVELVYLGAAYRWAHRHMKFITRLGGMGESSPHMQVMMVPISVVEQMKRALPSIMHVAWSSRKSNLDLFHTKLGKWEVSQEKLVNSLEKGSSIRRLLKDFGENNASEIYPLSMEEAKMIDLVAEGVDLSYLEIPEFLSNWDSDEKRGRKIISHLIKQKIMKLTYEVSDTSLVSLSIIANGKSDRVYSLVSSFLKNTPTSYARLDETGENAVILTRLPEESVYDIASQLTSKGIEQDINIRCMRPTTFRRYTSNLYQRLLKDDGTWDDDVSAFLSQARSKRKELSKSNA